MGDIKKLFELINEINSKLPNNLYLDVSTSSNSIVLRGVDKISYYKVKFSNPILLDPYKFKERILSSNPVLYFKLINGLIDLGLKVCPVYGPYLYKYFNNLSLVTNYRSKKISGNHISGILIDEILMVQIINSRITVTNLLTLGYSIDLEKLVSDIQLNDIIRTIKLCISTLKNIQYYQIIVRENISYADCLSNVNLLNIQAKIYFLMSIFRKFEQFITDDQLISEFNILSADKFNGYLGLGLLRVDTFYIKTSHNKGYFTSPLNQKKLMCNTLHRSEIESLNSEEKGLYIIPMVSTNLDIFLYLKDLYDILKSINNTSPEYSNLITKLSSIISNNSKTIGYIQADPYKQERMRDYNITISGEIRKLNPILSIKKSNYKHSKIFPLVHYLVDILLTSLDILVDNLVDPSKFTTDSRFLNNTKTKLHKLEGLVRYYLVARVLDPENFKS